MLTWAFILLAIAIATGVLGFSEISGATAMFAKIIFVVALVLLVVSLITGRTRPKH